MKPTLKITDDGPKFDNKRRLTCWDISKIDFSINELKINFDEYNFLMLELQNETFSAKGRKNIWVPFTATYNLNIGRQVFSNFEGKTTPQKELNDKDFYYGWIVPSSSKHGDALWSSFSYAFYDNGVKKAPSISISFVGSDMIISGQMGYSFERTSENAGTAYTMGSYIRTKIKSMTIKADSSGGISITDIEKSGTGGQVQGKDRGDYKIWTKDEI